MRLYKNEVFSLFCAMRNIIMYLLMKSKIVKGLHPMKIDDVSPFLLVKTLGIWYNCSSLNRRIEE